MSSKTLLFVVFIILIAVSYQAIKLVLSKEAKQENRLLLKDRVKGAVIGIIFWGVFIYFATAILQKQQ